MTCLECKSKFKFVDRLKSMNRKKGKIQCENCKTIFVIKGNSGRIVSSVVTGVMVAILSVLGVPLVEGDSENKILGALMIAGIVIIIVFIYYFIAQNWLKYEKLNEDLEK
ncbi:hypothetical protein [uncultured Clostridium sp.]|uniref:hypothetical protein n=1 Tax=uncultured Clostridium sp. TaxID=59620 RepID=UPI0026089170|nr:hypothetical protein [uncultured Clostridium sp.]